MPILSCSPLSPGVEESEFAVPTPTFSTQLMPLEAHFPYGVLLQLLAGLITYLLLVIYFRQRYGERPFLRRLRQLRWDIRQESPATTHLHIYIVIQTDIALLFLLYLWLNHQAIL